MAGACVGDGLRNNAGTIELYGPRSAAWPSGCAIGAANGLNTDPVTHKAWVAPALVITGRDVAPDLQVIHPTNDDLHQLGEVTMTQTVGACSRTFMQAHLGGGYAGFRLASGNFWRIQRRITLYVNGAPTAYTGLEDAAGSENNSGGITSQGSPLEAMPIIATLNAGDTIKVLAHYELLLDGFADNVANRLTYRLPRITAGFYTFT